MPTSCSHHSVRSAPHAAAALRDSADRRAHRIPGRGMVVHWTRVVEAAVVWHFRVPSGRRANGRTTAHTLHVSRSETGLDRLLPQQLDRLPQISHLIVLPLCGGRQLVESLRHVGQALLEGGHNVGLKGRRSRRDKLEL